MIPYYHERIILLMTQSSNMKRTESAPVDPDEIVAIRWAELSLDGFELFCRHFDEPVDPEYSSLALKSTST